MFISVNTQPQTTEGATIAHIESQNNPRYIQKFYWIYSIRR